MHIRRQKAQTVIELAVFGAILIFVLGAIIRAAVGSGNQQHAMLKATRMAMTTSHLHSEGKRIASRNLASVLIVEDRLSVASAKYGAIDRVPSMMQGSAVHSPNLFMPIDFGHEEDLPIMDLYVNARHFALSVAAFKTIHLAQGCANEPSPCPADCKGDCSASSRKYFRGTDVESGDEFWEENCIEHTTTQPPAACANADPCPAACNVDCSPASTGTYQPDPIVEYLGCAKLYTIIDNHPLIARWCDDDDPAALKSCSIPVPPCSSLDFPEPGCNLSADGSGGRFDLDREDLDGLSDTDYPPVVPPEQREGFSWQWYLVMGADETWHPPVIQVSRLRQDTAQLPVTTSRINVAEGIILPGGSVRAQHNSVDVDYDLKLENIVAGASAVGYGGVILSLAVQDAQDGDVDTSYNDGDKVRGVLPFGFTRDTNMYSFVYSGGPGGGTYLQIDEGKLFTAAVDPGQRQFIRTASKKDQIDIVERRFLLSNVSFSCKRVVPCPVDCNGDCSLTSAATYGHFCDAVGDPHPTANGIPNPVEACSLGGDGACFSTANRHKTCLDVANKALWMRSRIEDLHVRKWVTDVSEDDYVDLDVNN